MADIETFFKSKEKKKEELQKEVLVEMPEDKKPGKKRKIWIFSGVLAGFLVLGSAVGVSLFFYKKYRQTEKIVEQEKGEMPKNEAETVLENLDRVMELPQGEDPTIATVADKSKLLEQDFFQKAENGDKIIIYMGARRAILFALQ